MVFVLALVFILFLNGFSVSAQDLSLVPADEKTMLQRITDGKRDIDWADMNIQFCTAADASFNNGDFDNMAFKVHRVRLEVLGAFRDKFSYHFRQSFNKYTNPNIPLDNLAGSVELAMVGWQLNDKWGLTAGKQPVQFSGYECWVNAIKVRHYSDFNNTIPAYQVGLNMAYNINENQVMNFQLTNNRNSTINDQFMYSLPEDEKPSNGEDYRYIDPETRSIFQNMLENFRNRPEIPEEVYSYHHPDYPVELNVKNQWLVTLFYDPDNAYYLPDETIRKVLALPHEELRNDLEQIILFETGCTCGKISREQWDAPYASVLLHCLFFLMALDDARSLPVVLETLCQSKDYYEYHFGNVVTDVYVPVLYALGQNQLDKLFAYLQIPGLYNMFRYEVFPAVALVASRQPERRGEVIEWFRKVLQFYAPRLERQECCDGFLIGLMTSPILDLKAEELLPELKTLYDTGLVDEGCCGDYEHIAKEISSNNNFRNIERFSTDIYECYHNMKRFADK